MQIFNSNLKIILKTPLIGNILVWDTWLEACNFKAVVGLALNNPVEWILPIASPNKACFQKATRSAAGEPPVHLLVSEIPEIP